MMWRKFTRWLTEKYLPAWAKVEAAEERERLQKRVRELEEENRQLKSYITGMQDAMRRQRKIIINAGDKL